MDLADIFPANGKRQSMYCDGCGMHLRLSFTEFDEEISKVRISVVGLPVLECPGCSARFLPDRARLSLIYLHQKATKEGLGTVKLVRKKIVKDFGFTNAHFQYDPDDYYYIPGLAREEDDGFLTPVFFNKEVLIKYDHHPSYCVHFASRTYGQILQGDSINISFGINEHGRVVMWLGDIANLPDSEQHYLLSENIPSDHSLGCEFYDGQIEAKFTDLTSEDLLFEQRSRFLEACFMRYSKKIAHLEGEVLELAIAIRRPVVDTPSERARVADILNKVYVESFDNKILEQLLAVKGIPSEKLGSLKRLQKLLETLDTALQPDSLMSPLFVIYDLRVAYSHLGSNTNLSKDLEKILNRLDLPTDANLSDIYDQIILRLRNSFSRLADSVVGSNPKCEENDLPPI